MISHCEQCGREFSRGVAPLRRNRHCSVACKTIASRKVDVAKLRELALVGTSLGEMARQLGTKRNDTVRVSLKREGLHRDWKARRLASRRRVVSPGLLVEYAEKGTPLLHVAVKLGWGHDAVRIEMIRQGLYRLWSQHRYKKCAVAA